MTRDVIDVVTTILGIVILATFVLSLASVAYIIRVYRGSAKTSAIFRMLVRADALKVFAASWIGALVVIRLIILPEGVTLPTWTAPISAIAVEILLIPPILHAVTIAKLRRDRGVVGGSHDELLSRADPEP